MRAKDFVAEATRKLEPAQFQQLITPEVQRLDKAMSQAGFEVRIVGGAVRDLVQSKDPKDIDMATNATPDEMMQVFDEASIRYEPTGLQHGTLTVIIDGEPIEITTLRIDTDQDGRHANVEFTKDWELDAQRRDLTYNAMSMELDGTLHDYFGGEEDLKQGVSKFVGDAGSRMEEDFLRILRYFRFQSRLGSPQWDEQTLATVKEKAQGLTKISGERIWAELGKILSSANAADILSKMDETGVSKHIGLRNSRRGNLTNVKKFSNDPLIALAALTNTIFDLEELKAMWKFSNAEFQAMAYIIEHRDDPFDETVAKKMMTQPKANPEHIKMLALSLGKQDIAGMLKTWEKPTFPITGKDLQAAGIKPGPDMGRILNVLRKEWEESGFSLDKAALLRIM